ncbi:MAG: hypothetical protein ONB46_22350 [candidate division KSB1 bacterium]|nr:hypothetical protein [candidate division KSB1 bacterium]MDZ7368622.1 hypothetical protein [candidate division KSB1 bacterium]MDZ7406342.1 hypothetical protein [candidate division KSB1 bacterium]
MQTTAPRGLKITPSLKQEIIKIIDARIKDAHVTREDFSELKGIVKDIGIKVGELAEAQKRTELRVEELAQAQKQTELRVEELAQAQKRTEVQVQKLAEGLDEMRQDVGGMSRSMGYAFENEVYRFLPEVLKRKYGIEVKEKIVRAEIGGKEVNLFCRALRDGREVLIIGEAKTRLDDRREKRDIFQDLEDKVKAVLAEYGAVEIARVLVTHFATKGFLDQATASGIIVVQSFEW